MTTSNFCFIKGLMCIRKIIFLYSCISLIGGCGHLLKSSAHIKNSFESIKQIQVPAATQGTLHCNQIIAPVIDVPGITFYKDIDRSKGGHASIIDPEKMAIRNALVKPISDFNFQIDGLADQIWREQGTNQTTVTCFIDSLHLWAKAGALLGEATEQGEFERNWALSGIALAYLKASPFLKAGDPQKQLVIQLWMEKIAHKVQLSFDDHIERVSRKNNLSVWAGLAVQATSVAINNQEMYRWAVAKIKSNISTIDQNGYLPNELIRGQRALHYHCFALQPLMMSAFLASSNNEDLFLSSSGALDKLALATIESLDQPEKLQKIVGFTQELPEKRVRSWIEVYHFLRPEMVSSSLMDSIRPASEKWLGGDLTLVFGH